MEGQVCKLYCKVAEGGKKKYITLRAGTEFFPGRDKSCLVINMRMRPFGHEQMVYDQTKD